jgi:hypothetical protein
MWSCYDSAVPEELIYPDLCVLSHKQSGGLAVDPQPECPPRWIYDLRPTPGMLVKSGKLGSRALRRVQAFLEGKNLHIPAPKSTRIGHGTGNGSGKDSGSKGKAMGMGMGSGAAKTACNPGQEKVHQEEDLETFMAGDVGLEGHTDSRAAAAATVTAASASAAGSLSPRAIVSVPTVAATEDDGNGEEDEDVEDGKISLPAPVVVPVSAAADAETDAMIALLAGDSDSGDSPLATAAAASAAPAAASTTSTPDTVTDTTSAHKTKLSLSTDIVATDDSHVSQARRASVSIDDLMSKVGGEAEGSPRGSVEIPQSQAPVPPLKLSDGAAVPTATPTATATDPDTSTVDEVSMGLTIPAPLTDPLPDDPLDRNVTISSIAILSPALMRPEFDACKVVVQLPGPDDKTPTLLLTSGVSGKLDARKDHRTFFVEWAAVLYDDKAMRSGSGSVSIVGDADGTVLLKGEFRIGMFCLPSKEPLVAEDHFGVVSLCEGTLQEVTHSDGQLSARASPRKNPAGTDALPMDHKWPKGVARVRAVLTGIAGETTANRQRRFSEFNPDDLAKVQFSQLSVLDDLEGSGSDDEDEDKYAESSFDPLGTTNGSNGKSGLLPTVEQSDNYDDEDFEENY